MLLAYRAAGQALAAYHHGAKIDDVRVTGLSFFFPGRTSRRAELLIDLAITLGGVAAVSRYAFGPMERDATVVSWCFDEVQREDLREAHAIVSELAPLGDDDVFFLAWRQALEFVAADWNRIECLVAHIIRSPVSHADVEELIEIDLLSRCG